MEISIPTILLLIMPYILYKIAIDWDRTWRRIILADLIEGMYKRQGGEAKEEYSKYWSKHGYRLVPLGEILTHKEIQDVQDKGFLQKEYKNQYFGVLRGSGAKLDCSGRRLSAARIAGCRTPDWVVAIRGTNITCLSDLQKDMNIPLQQLHKNSTIKLMRIVVNRLRENVGCRNLAITGHSLGAAMGMLIAREFALQDYVIESHFFNPPFCTFHSFGRKFGPNWKWLTKLRQSVSTWVNNAFDGGAGLRQQEEEYKKLSQSEWCPYMYLNRQDFVCNSYISHDERNLQDEVYQLSQEMNIDRYYVFGSCFLGFFFGDTHTYHLFPRGIWYMAKLKNQSSDIQSRLDSHKLSHWMKPNLPLGIKTMPQRSFYQEFVFWVSCRNPTASSLGLGLFLYFVVCTLLWLDFILATTGGFWFWSLLVASVFGVRFLESTVSGFSSLADIPLALFVFSVLCYFFSLVYGILDGYWFYTLVPTGVVRLLDSRVSGFNSWAYVSSIFSIFSLVCYFVMVLYGALGWFWFGVVILVVLLGKRLGHQFDSLLSHGLAVDLIMFS
ncbi:hypothetical protein R1sor_011844 [Riccia sorocarpa]|uniref:Triacylglycerol lipase n=1 Tax=Riccia sorocarpa TaxID=122646 RepID=A0ABD3I220_9MARC